MEEQDGGSQRKARKMEKEKASAVTIPTAKEGKMGTREGIKMNVDHATCKDPTRNKRGKKKSGGVYKGWNQVKEKKVNT